MNSLNCYTKWAWVCFVQFFFHTSTEIESEKVAHKHQKTSSLQHTEQTLQIEKKKNVVTRVHGVWWTLQCHPFRALISRWHVKYRWFNWFCCTLFQCDSKNNCIQNNDYTLVEDISGHISHVNIVGVIDQAYCLRLGKFPIGRRWTGAYWCRCMARTKSIGSI